MRGRVDHGGVDDCAVERAVRAALRFHAAPNPPRSAAACLARLDASRLYQRREMEARVAMDAARRAAFWYLSPEYAGRYLDVVTPLRRKGM